MSVFLRLGLGMGRGKYVNLSTEARPCWHRTRGCGLRMDRVCGWGGVMRAQGVATRSVVKSKWNPMSIFLLFIPAGTFCLGTWQVQRRQWKLNLIKELQSKTTALPIDLPEDLGELEDLEYQRVRLTGTFDHEREIFLGPRPLLVGGDVQHQGSGLISTGQSGYLVVTPFILADRNSTILVNRGWVSRKQRNPETRIEGQPSGLVKLTAIVRKTEDRSPFMPKSTRRSTLFTYRDVNSMAAMVGAAPVFLDAVDTIPGGPQGCQTRITLRNEHFSYLLTWYSLSLATSYLWYRRFVQGKV